MSKRTELINIAVIAHVDAGKSTLVDAFLQQSNVFRDNEALVDCVMDSNDLERERGITIYAKNCSIMYGDIKVNIVDTPGHADFSSEIERIIKTVDTVILLVDSSEGPMPQTRFVLQKSLELGLKPILLINKIDKKDQRAEEVVDEVFDLFVELGANEEQLEFPILYGIAKEGIVVKELSDEQVNLGPLFDTILEHTSLYPDLDNEPLQMQVSSLAYDDYIGRLGIGRVFQGVLKTGEQITVSREDGSLVKKSITKMFNYQGLSRIEIEEARSGEIVVFAGIDDISIGETLVDASNPMPLPMITIEEPTLSMNFLVNKSPFCGQEGKFVTSRQLKDRLEKELEVNVGLKVQPMESNAEGFKVSGRGELHLSILLENMRREGFEVAVSKPEVLMRKNAEGKVEEPLEKVIVDVPEAFSGGVINALNIRKGEMLNMSKEGEYIRLEYLVPTRGLIGYRGEFINETRGEGVMVRGFDSFGIYKGAIDGRKNGVFVSTVTDTTMGYSLMAIEERGTLFVIPQTKIYEGMIVGQNSRDGDLVVNVCKNKKMSNVRSSGADEAIKLRPAKIMTLEEALEFIEDDELVEVTPLSIRLRKKFLLENDRKRNQKTKTIVE